MPIPNTLAVSYNLSLKNDVAKFKEIASALHDLTDPYVSSDSDEDTTTEPAPVSKDQQTALTTPPLFVADSEDEFHDFNDEDDELQRALRNSKEIFRNDRTSK